MSFPTSMRALQLQAVGRLAEVRLPVPQPRPDEVVVCTASTTICTSDLKDIARNPFGIAFPRVLGHEGAGVVVQIGTDVKTLCVGDRVAAHPVISCRECENCRRGLGHLCSNMGHLGLDRDGTFAEYFRIRADRARRLPPEIEFSIAPLLEPLAVCLEAVKRGRVRRGETVLVVGDGPFGLLIARLAKRFDPAKIILVGQHEFRLQQATEAVTINQTCTSDVPCAVHKANDGRGADVAILATSSPSAMESGLASLRARGRLVVFCDVQGTPSVNWFRLHTQELEILGTCNDEDCVDAATDLLAEPSLRLSSLITHRLPFEQWPLAFDMARNGKNETLKVALMFDGSP